MTKAKELLDLLEILTRDQAREQADQLWQYLFKMDGLRLEQKITKAKEWFDSKDFQDSDKKAILKAWSEFVVKSMTKDPQFTDKFPDAGDIADAIGINFV